MRGQQLRGSSFSSSSSSSSSLWHATLGAQGNFSCTSSLLSSRETETEGGLNLALAAARESQITFNVIELLRVSVTNNYTNNNKTTLYNVLSRINKYVLSSTYCSKHLIYQTVLSTSVYHNSTSFTKIACCCLSVSRVECDAHYISKFTISLPC